MKGTTEDARRFDRPMSKRTFRKTVKKVAENEDFETSFKVDGLHTDADDEYAITSYYVNNALMDDEEIEAEAREFRMTLERLGVKTFSIDGDVPSYIWFGVEYPNVTSDGFEAFTSRVSELVENNRGDTFLTITDETNTEFVTLSASYDPYNRSGRSVQQDVDSVIEAIESEGYDVRGGDVYDGYVSATVEYAHDE